jgi:hypothetical protein
LISFCFCRVHLQHPLRQEGQEIVHHIRPFLACDEVASLVFGQADIHGSQDLGWLAIGVELLAGPGRALLSRRVAAELRWNIPVTKSILPFFVR